MKQPLNPRDKKKRAMKLLAAIAACSFVGNWVLLHPHDDFGVFPWIEAVLALVAVIAFAIVLADAKGDASR